MAVDRQPTTGSIELPIINIAEANPVVGKTMLDAAVKYGFLYVDSASSGLSNQDVERAFDTVGLPVGKL